MCYTCQTYNHLQINAYDPTRTLTLRNTFVRDSNARFRDLIKIVREAVTTQDCFALTEPGILSFAELTAPGNRAFDHTMTADQVAAFMAWLESEELNSILEEGRTYGYGPWTNQYIEDAYKRGIIRANVEMRQAGYDVPTMEDLGGVLVLISILAHQNRLQVLQMGTYEGLKGISSQMNTQIMRVLAQGLTEGVSRDILTKRVISVINGKGAANLGTTDTLGRFIPAQRRAELLARTEVVRAHHQAMIEEYRRYGVTGVEVMAEFITAGDENVCPECSGYHGNTYTLKEVEHMIPVHPQCRCIAIPTRKE